ncbi:MAG TPA: hypothetical protein EYP92_01260 [Candidatus Thioglobus sp.]|nr:hypothetical protein [Candidatus Thioglobus sp.]
MINNFSAVMGSARTLSNLERYYGNVLNGVDCKYITTGIVRSIKCDVFYLYDLDTYFTLHYTDAFDTVKRVVSVHEVP